jgi:tetratricopeptide (TPR) repeat protein
MTVFEKTSKINALLGWTAVLIGAGSWFHPAVAGSDLWWHLASGREILQTGGIPPVDSFSHTAAGEIWTNHEWLWEVLYWGVYRLHPDAVACLNFGVVLSVFGMAAWVARRVSGSLFAAGAATWLAAAASHWFLDIRPHVFSLLFVGILLVTRERRWAPWLWPPLFLVWANLHSGFVFGLGLVGLHVLFRTWEVSRPRGRLVIPRAEWIGLAAASLIMLANPYGWRILEYPAAYLDSSSRFRTLIEWHPPGFGLDPRGFEGRFIYLLGAVALGVPRGLRRAPYLVALAGVACLMALTARRFIPLFAVTAAPVAALGIAVVAEQARARLSVLGRPAAHTGLAAGAVLVGALLWYNVRFFPQPLYRWTQGELYPAGAIQYLHVLPDPPKRLLNLYNWGGYVMLHAPEIPVFIDGRANTVYGERIYNEYGRVYGAGPGYETILRKHQVDGVLAPPNAAIIRALEQKRSSWQIAFADPVAVLLLPVRATVSGSSVPDPGEVLPEGAELWLVRGTSAHRRGELMEAERNLGRAIELNPLSIPAYSELLVIAAQRRDRAAIEHWTSTAARLYPREASRILGNAGRAYAQIGDIDAALASMRKAIPRGPFRSAKQIEAQIRRLEAQRRKQAGSR